MIFLSFCKSTLLLARLWFRQTSNFKGTYLVQGIGPFFYFNVECSKSISDLFSVSHNHVASPRCVQYPISRLSLERLQTRGKRVYEKKLNFALTRRRRRCHATKLRILHVKIFTSHLLSLILPPLFRHLASPSTSNSRIFHVHTL